MRPGAGSSAPLRRSSGRPWLSSGTREARTVAAAVARVLADTPELGREQVTEPDSPTRFGDSTTFYRCSVAALSRRMAPGTVDLIAAFPPAHARLATFSDLAALATRALTREWVMMVAVIDTDRLPEMLARIRRYGPEWIMEFSLLFTTPVATSGEPHRIALRRVALLVYGKPGARLSGKEDVIEVRAPGSDAEGRALGLEDGMAPVVRRFASQGQVVCDHMVGGRSRVVLAAIRGGCTFIGADENQWRIYRVLEQLAGAVTESPPPDQERPERWCSFRPTAGYTQHPVPSVPGRGIHRLSAYPSGRFAAAIANTSGWGTTSNCWRTPKRGRAVNQRRRSGTCRYRTPHTRPEARAGRFSWSRAPRPATESWPGTSGSRFLTASEGVDMVSCSTGWRQSSYGRPDCGVPECYVVQL